MKKVFYKLTVILSLVVFTTSCNEEVTSFDVDNGETAFLFFNASQPFPVSPTENTLDVAVGVTTKSNVQRTYQVFVNEDATTAPVGTYSIDTSSLVIEPNTFNGTFTVTGNFDLIPDGDSVFLVLDLIPAIGYGMPDRDQISIEIFKSCPLTESIAGAHTYVSSNLIRGQSTSPNCAATPTGTVTWTEVAGTNLSRYRTTDMSFGMFASCWGVPGGAASASLRIEWVCNKFTALGLDQYGDSYTYTIVSVVGSQLSLNWSNSYGDSGSVVITRQGGLDWPELLQD